MVHLHRRIVPRLGILLGTVLLATATPAGTIPAQAAPQLRQDILAEPYLYDHQCAVIGNDGLGNRAVHCANLFGQYHFEDAPTILDLYGETELVCQNSAGTIVECAAIYTTAALCAADFPCLTNSLICGARWGYASCDAQYWVTTGRVGDDSPRYALPVGARLDDVWAVSMNATIVLPGSGKLVGGIGTNKATAHFNIGA
jgi:hypothetical protein